MSLAVFGVAAALTLSSPAPAAAAGHRAGASRKAAATAAPAVNDLYAARARRRMASYLRLRVLELRIAGLRRAAEVVERHLSIDTLLREQSIFDPGR